MLPAGRSYESLELVIDLFTNEGVEAILRGEIPDSDVEAGRQYTFGFTITTTGAFKGVRARHVLSNPVSD